MVQLQTKQPAADRAQVGVQEGAQPPPVPAAVKSNPENVTEDRPAAAERGRYSKVVTFRVPAGESYALHSITEKKAGEISQGTQGPLARGVAATSVANVGVLGRNGLGGAGTVDLILGVDKQAKGVVVLSLEPPRAKGHVYEVPKRFYAIGLDGTSRQSQLGIDVTTLEPANMDAAAATKKDEVSVVIISAHWCAPCGQQLPRTLAAVGEHAATKGANIRVGYLDGNAEANAALLTKYAVDSFPTTLVFRNGGAEPIRVVGTVSVSQMKDAFKGIAPPEPK